MRALWSSSFVLVATIGFIGCAGSDEGSHRSNLGTGTGGSSTGRASSATSAIGGTTQSGGQASSPPATTGGSQGVGGTSDAPRATGGSSATGVSGTGGTKSTAVASSAGGGSKAASGGATASGGTSSLASTRPTTGGIPATGGAVATGGVSSTTGGVAATGGGSSTKAAAGGSPATGGATAAAGASAGGGSADVKPSAGCGKTPTLKNSPSAANQNTLSVGGSSRQFLVRWPTDYNNAHPYRLILGFHGAGGSDTEVAPSYFGLVALANNSTIFVAPSASGGYWNATSDLAFVDEILKAVQSDLCIDTSRVEIEGFSQGGAMVAVLACQRPGVFRAAVGHSRGGLTAPTSCDPIPYLGSLGLNDISGNSQATQTDSFAKSNGCTISTMPLATAGSHVCTKYSNCPATEPVTFCSFDGPHTPSPTDSGKSASWMPQEVWSFFSQF